MKKLLAYLAATLVFNTAIACVLTLFIPSIPFWYEFVYSQCIGLSVLSINVTVAAFVRNGVTRLAVLCITLLASVALGLTLAFAVSGVGSWDDEHVLKTMATGLFFGLIGAIAFLLSERIEMEVRYSPPPHAGEGLGERVEVRKQLNRDLTIFQHWYNHIRPHQNLDGRAPAEAWNGINPYTKPHKQEQWFEAWNGLLTGYHLRY